MIDDLQDRWDRMKIAYGPVPGTWAEIWVPGVCKHEVVRCTHGDEIIGRNFRRRVCMICARSLRGRMPRFCWFTGKDHPNYDSGTR